MEQELLNSIEGVLGVRRVIDIWSTYVALPAIGCALAIMILFIWYNPSALKIVGVAFFAGVCCVASYFLQQPTYSVVVNNDFKRSALTEHFEIVGGNDVILRLHVKKDELEKHIITLIGHGDPNR